MVLCLTQLPEEVLHLILSASPPRSAVTLGQTSHRFRNVASEPLLWRHYCHTHYKFWDAKHGILDKLTSPVSSTDWKGLFILRYHIDCSVIRLLDSILSSQTGRIEKFQAVIGFGYDAKDALLQQSEVESSGEDYLARR